VYPHREKEGAKEDVPVMEGLRVERGKFFRARIDGSLEPLAR